MARRMLIDATHAEETRVAVVTGNRLEEFDFESSRKKQIKGNIYLAKVTRVEPSLQAAFVEYGGNRHGFLAFGEIHPDYYRVPIADREALNRLVAEAVAEQDGDDYVDAAPPPTAEDRAELRGEDESAGDYERELSASERRPAAPENFGPDDSGAAPLEARAERATQSDFAAGDHAAPADPAAGPDGASGANDDGYARQPSDDGQSLNTRGDEAPAEIDPASGEAEPDQGKSGNGDNSRSGTPAPEPVETMGGDDVEDIRRRHRVWQRRYKIQEVIRKRQILLVQVAKEERGNKGAALTTYISLAGRYCVLMPNTPRGGGISRKITNQSDRRRLKEMLAEFDLPEGMAVIVRTAGMERSQVELKRDLDFLLKTWSDIREKALTSTAPALIYEEANLIKRSIRDLYAQDIDDILVDGHEGFVAAKNYMSLMMPSHAKKVAEYTEKPIPLFHRFQVESQIDNMHSPTVQLRSGGYVVLNPTEALVAIDVNSGRSTRERNVEETAYRTNLEAADEIARQLRLRDLAGLIVIDFIDMEEGRYRHNVERRLKDALKQDRARIQVGRISAFGLLEMSRQRIRPSLVEASMMSCPHCGGAGHVRSTESMALTVLRAIEEEGLRQRSAEITVALPTTVALYIFNHKRAAMAEIEARHGFRIVLQPDDTITLASFRIARSVAKAAEARQQAERASEPRPVRAAEADVAEPTETRERGERLPGHDAPAEGQPLSEHRAERLVDDVSADEAGAEPAERESRGRGRDGDGEKREGDDRRGRRRGRRGGRRRRGRQRGDSAGGDSAGGDTAGPEAVGGEVAGDEVSVSEHGEATVAAPPSQGDEPSVAGDRIASTAPFDSPPAESPPPVEVDREVERHQPRRTATSRHTRRHESDANEAHIAAPQPPAAAPRRIEAPAMPEDAAPFARPEPAHAASTAALPAPAESIVAAEDAPGKPARRGWWSLRRN